MSYISLYRKYRPKKFSEVVGQNVIIKILKNSIINNKINHAYIFSGPRGTGKTSVAKIFAKAVNCLNNANGDICTKCDNCIKINEDNIDIVEIDAASNNGVEEIREIKNTISFMPSYLKYKVYIIDEVHMLSISAFNALLKTLEEPPSHAIFILATTEINKIPATVLSRCQRFDFKKIEKNDIKERLRFICNEEKLLINDDILELISNLSDGGLRDAINLLDQLVSLNKEELTRTDVYNLIGYTDESEVFSLLDYIINCDIKNIIKFIHDSFNLCKNFNNIVNCLENIIRNIIIFNNTDSYFDKAYEEKLYKYSKINIDILIKISDDLFQLNFDLKKNINQKILSEITLLKIALYFNNNSKNDNTTQDDGNNIGENDTFINQEEKDILINNVLSRADKEVKNKFIEKFSSINEYLTSKDYNNVSNLLVKSTPEVVSDEIVLFTFKNNFDVILFDKNIDDIVKILYKVYRKKYKVVSIVDEKWVLIKKDYIKNIKSGVKYKYIDTTSKKSGKIKKNELENSVEDIFGEKYISED